MLVKTGCAPTVSANRSFAEDASTGSWNSSCAGLSPLFSTTTPVSYTHLAVICRSVEEDGVYHYCLENHLI